MSRTRKHFATAAERKKHEAGLARRRAKTLEAKQLKAVEEAAAGDANLQAIVDAEKARITQPTASQRAGSHRSSPRRIAAARENLSAAFDLMGGVPALVKWGKQYPTEFYRIWARLIPKESVELSAQLPLETLLEKLSGRASQSVSDAAFSIGSELLTDARNRVIDQPDNDEDEDLDIGDVA